MGARVKSEGQEQGDDEFDYDEEFQDDEEGIAKIDDLADEQETKELEVRVGRCWRPNLAREADPSHFIFVMPPLHTRLRSAPTSIVIVYYNNAPLPVDHNIQERIKKEMRAANRYEGVPEDDDDDEEWEQLTNTGKDVKKLVRKNDRTGAYDSDNDASVSRPIHLDGRCLAR